MKNGLIALSRSVYAGVSICYLGYLVMCGGPAIINAKQADVQASAVSENNKV